MPTLNEWFTKIIIINLARRPDRWEHAQKECEKHGIVAERFEGLDFGKGTGNQGCTESHGAVLRLIVENGWKRTLILEDDFEFRFDNSQNLFGEFVEQLPPDWFMVYLGGHFADYNNRQISKNVIRFEYMKTTSSYGVTLEAAMLMAPHVYGASPIDEVYHGWHEKYPCYIFTPRLCVQYENYSDLQCHVMNNRACMEDQQHEDVLRGIRRIEPTRVIPEHDIPKPLPQRDGRLIRY